MNYFTQNAEIITMIIIIIKIISIPCYSRVYSLSPHCAANIKGGNRDKKKFMLEGPRRAQSFVLYSYTMYELRN